MEDLPLHNDTLLWTKYWQLHRRHLLNSHHYAALLHPPLIHYIWIIYDMNTPHMGGRRREMVRNWNFWKVIGMYCPMLLVKTAELDPNKNYMCGYHPHGKFAAGAFLNFATEATECGKVFPGIKPHLISHSGLFFAPLLREFLMWIGDCASSKESINHILSKQGTGNAVVVTVGGQKEVIFAAAYIMHLKLKTRKGFVRLAIRNGADLVPIVCLGENELFPDVVPKSLRPYLYDLTKIKNLLVVPIAAMLGGIRYGMPWPPKKSPVYTIVGKPIEVVQEKHPSDETVDRYHQLYLQNLQQLFDEHKQKIGGKYKNVEMTFY